MQGAEFVLFTNEREVRFFLRTLATPKAQPADDFFVLFRYINESRTVSVPLETQAHLVSESMQQ